MIIILSYVNFFVKIPFFFPSFGPGANFSNCSMVVKQLASIDLVTLLILESILSEIKTNKENYHTSAFKKIKNLIKYKISMAG